MNNISKIIREEWKSIKGYEGIYEVSNFGQVRSLDRLIRASNGVTRRTKGRDLKPQKNRGGYLFVNLKVNGINNFQRIHRLVAINFILGEDLKLHINHKNGIKTDNNIDNLEWTTQKENNSHARKLGLNKHEGENHYSSKITIGQAREIKERALKGESVTALAKIFGISHQCISDIKLGKSWKSI